MAEYNMRIAQRNEYGGVDIFYPQTKADIVIESPNRRFVTAAQLQGLVNAESTESKNQPNGYPGLDENGKININQIPREAVTQRFDANSEETMLALPAKVGDIVCRTDLNNMFFMLTVNNPVILDGWVVVSGGSSGGTGGAVDSVNGKTGIVVIGKQDVGLGNVTNESKETMFSNPTLTGVVSVPTAAPGTKNKMAASTEFVANSLDNMPKVVVSGLFPGTPKKDDVFMKVIE